MTMAPSAGFIDGREHLLPVRVYYEDTDFTGVVYHANYLRYFERGRSDFLRLSGVSHTALRGLDEPVAFVVIHMDIHFKKAARIDDALVVRTAYRQIKGPRLFVGQSILRQGELIAAAEVEIACIGMDGRARRPPRAVLDGLKAWILQPAP